MAKYPKRLTVLADPDGFIWVEAELSEPRARAIVKQYLAQGIYLSPMQNKQVAA